MSPARADDLAREEILASVRASLRGGRGPAGPARPAERRPGPEGTRERVETFRALLERVGGQCVVAEGEGEAARALRAIVEELGGAGVALSDSPLVRRLAESLPEGLDLLEDPSDRAALLHRAGVGVTAAQWGIAETGTLVLESDRERHRLVSLLPPLHVAILPAERILGTLGEALEKIGRAGSGGPASALTWITGPSRTADIELTLVIGVHGPRELRVIVVMGEDG